MVTTLEIMEQSSLEKVMEQSSFGESVKELKNLQQLTLDIRSNSIGDNGAKYIGESVKELKNLQQLTLYFYGNNIGDNGAKFIGESVKELKNLSQLNLDIRYNQMEQSSLEKVQRN
eukprot:TRINITY_DN215_c0_g1_i25.p2 TRINITY_DN215_c0_g1~~TRINITY_DN215_c0_g1_i25.p2  ORF type:complete len:116 (-),score=20.83 TRINITY_DN215_c0_g1_i25:238-585(-)